MENSDDEEGSKKSNRFMSSNGRLGYILSGFILEVDPVTYFDGGIKAVDKDLNNVVFYTSRHEWFKYNIDLIEKGASGSKVSKNLMKTGYFPADKSYEFLLYDDALILEEESLLAGRFTPHVIDELSKHIRIKKDSELLEQKVITLDPLMMEVYGKEFTVQLREHYDKEDFVVGFNGSIAQRTEIDVGKDPELGRRFFGYLSKPDIDHIGHLLRFQSRHKHQEVALDDFLKEEHIDKKEILHYSLVA